MMGHGVGGGYPPVSTGWETEHGGELQGQDPEIGGSKGLVIYTWGGSSIN